MKIDSLEPEISWGVFFAVDMYLDASFCRPNLAVIFTALKIAF